MIDNAWPVRWCETCESHHEPVCGEMYARGLLALTSEQYFALVEGVPMPVIDEDDEGGAQ